VAYNSEWSSSTRKGYKKKQEKTTQKVTIYFISEALTGSKRYYSKMEKICYAVVMSAGNLRHYF
jgi:hypothetical protein